MLDALVAFLYGVCMGKNRARHRHGSPPCAGTVMTCASTRGSYVATSGRTNDGPVLQTHRLTAAPRPRCGRCPRRAVRLSHNQARVRRRLAKAEVFEPPARLHPAPGAAAPALHKSRHSYRTADHSPEMSPPAPHQHPHPSISVPRAWYCPASSCRASCSPASYGYAWRRLLIPALTDRWVNRPLKYFASRRSPSSPLTATYDCTSHSRLVGRLDLQNISAACTACLFQQSDRYVTDRLRFYPTIPRLRIS